MSISSCHSRLVNHIPIMPEHIEVLSDSPAKLGEGPIWWNDRLYWVDILSGELRAYDPVSDSHRAWRLGQAVGTVVPRRREGQFVIALADGLYFLDLGTQDLIRLEEPESDQMAGRFNDGKCDPAGRLWVGTMAERNGAGIGHLYRLDPDGSLAIIKDGIGCSNGIAWSLDQRRMYYIDSTPNQLYAFDYSLEDGSISNEEVLLQYPVGPGFPVLDGMTLDSMGNLWIGLWGGAAVICFNPETRQEITRIPVPAWKVTACAFGGPGLMDLYITTASTGMTDEQMEQYPHSGRLFRCRPGVAGCPAFPFAG